MIFKIRFYSPALGIGLLLSATLFIACTKTSENEKQQGRGSVDSESAVEVNVQYAKRFSVQQQNGYRLVTVNQPWKGAKSNLYYALVNKYAENPALPDSIEVIKIPVRNLVCTSTTHLPAIEYFGDAEKLIGFPSTKYIYSNVFREALNREEIAELGSESGINMELLMGLNPDLVVDFAMGGKYDKFKLISKMGIPVVVNADYMEETALGRAEWIKFMGLFLGREQKADSIFNVIKDNYLNYCAIAKKAKSKPGVFSGIVYGDIWFMPGGNNFGAKFMEDANGNYLWQNDSSRGSIKLSFEAVYEKANQADFWIGLSSVNSLDELINMDDRYGKFKAYQLGQVYGYNNRVRKDGGNDFLESGYLRPDLILADLIKIIHPELLPSHQLYYYSRLE